MFTYNKKIKEISARLLSEGVVDLVIGYRKGTVPMVNEPSIARKPADLNDFVWDGNCGLNLANYLTNRKEKIGVVVKGCDARSINNHIVEGKIQRDRLFIIGIPCKGMLDRHEISAQFEDEILQVNETVDGVVVSGADFEKTLDRSGVLQKNCTVCMHRNPVIADEMVADRVEEQTGENRFEEVEKIEAMGVDERWVYFEDLFSTCIRCYACRNTCPLCYCPTCFLDESKPQWVGKADDPADIRTFHFLRAYHCAGRCTDCGACVRVCPMGIDIRAITKKLEKDCFEKWGWEAGMTSEKRTALETFKPDDPEDFIK